MKDCVWFVFLFDYRDKLNTSLNLFYSVIKQHTHAQKANFSQNQFKRETVRLLSLHLNKSDARQYLGEICAG